MHGAGCRDARKAEARPGADESVGSIDKQHSPPDLLFSAREHLRAAYERRAMRGWRNRVNPVVSLHCVTRWQLMLGDSDDPAVTERRCALSDADAAGSPKDLPRS